MKKPLILSATISFLLLLFVWIPPAISVDFRVSPISLSFGQNRRSGLIDVYNDAEKSLQVQIRAFEWTQDAEGKDQYEETKDIIFFPRLLHFEGKEKKSLRAGIKMPPPAREKTYRLYVEEIPDPTENNKGSQVQVTVRFGVPIFVVPAKAEEKGEIEAVSLGNGSLKVKVRNTGNSHFKIKSVKITGVDAEGIQTVSNELDGWYLLTGAVRTYEMPLSQENCADTAKFNVEVTTNKFDLHGQLDVIKTLCMP